MTLSPRFLMTVVIFALVMPGLPIVVLTVLSFPVFAYSATSLFHAGGIFAMLVAVGYGAGLFPAAAVGAAVAFRDQIGRGGAGAGYAALAGLVGGLVSIGVIALFAFDASGLFAMVLAAALVIAVLGALLAWWLTRPRIVPLSAA